MSVDCKPLQLKLIEQDPWLGPYGDAVRYRYLRYQEARHRIAETEGSLSAFARGHEYLGLNRGESDGRTGVWYREWAPGAAALYFIGDFNDWDRRSHPMTRDAFGVWSLFLPDDEHADRLVHTSRIKVHVVSSTGAMDRIPAYIRRAVFEGEAHLTGQYWCPDSPYVWRNSMPAIVGSPRIYEAHVGMAQENPRVGTYNEFAENVLPRITAAGYNCVQLMAIQEHPYYASFGYQVSNFFAASSRFGTPEELKALVDAAHGHGLRVLIDLVHSHAVMNVHDGLNEFDGTDYHYFHAGPRGYHQAWDSRVFDYGQPEVLRFLLSNVRFWLEEYRFDGIRFDGVTSMMFLDHGLERTFTSYDDYFGGNIDEDAVTYLQFACEVAHDVNPQAILIAEDVSGMVGMARPLAEGGLGFDYRLAMGVPDFWIKLLKEKSDEQWNMGELFHVLTNRRAGEKHIVYAESHDQAMVGDKTLAFRLMDADMYWHMSEETAGNMRVERGIALHKMIRLITFTLGGEGYLTFMGNEFGHPEWIDFPRAGNDNSYHHARRQWSLADDPRLRYRGLGAFDRGLQTLDQQYGLLADPFIEVIQIHEERKLLIFRRGPLVVALNFHHEASYPDLRIGVPDATDYHVILNTDDRSFGGRGIVGSDQAYPRQEVPCDGRGQSTQMYLPARTGQVLAPDALHVR